MREEPSPAGGREQGEGGSNSRKARRGGANHPHPNPLPGGEGDTGRLSSYAIPLVRPAALSGIAAIIRRGKVGEKSGRPQSQSPQLRSRTPQRSTACSAR